MSNLLDLKSLLESSKKIAIFSHTSPDADAICSSLALKNIIEASFKNENKIIDIFIDMGDGVPALYEPIVGDNPISNRRVKQYDLAISLDCPQTNRFLKYENIFLNAKNTVNIDHHETNTNFAQHNFVVSRASSTGEILYQFAKVLNLNLTPQACKHIFTCILTDTVCLTQNNVSKLTYKVLAELSGVDFDQDEVKNHFFKNNTKAKTFLLQKALSSIRFYEDDKVAIMRITQKDMEKFEATQEDTLGIVEHANNIEGVVTAAIIIETEPQKCYVSLRGKGDIKVNEIAKAFNGGGHTNMAAFQFVGEVKELQTELSEKMIQAVREKELQEQQLNKETDN
jgi:phosphoesterase RecJ-like protein